MKALINARILTPTGFQNHQSVLFEQQKVVAVCDDTARPAEAVVEHDLAGMTLVPGFVDVQVNGGGGVLFNDHPTVEAIAAIGAAHRKTGTTGFLPTLISGDPELMARAIKAVDEAMKQGVPGVLGIHLEGPFLNPQKCGVHDKSRFRRIGDKELELVTRLERGVTLLTLAPERTNPGIIRTLRDRGIILAAGHTMASYAQTLLALDAGLSGFTHLFNAMPQLHSRDPGIIAAALEDKRAWCGIIADGLHVHPAMLRLAMRAGQGEQIFLVTDAMPSVGAADKAFFLDSARIVVKNGKCTTADGTLAGSDLDMASAVRNAMAFFDLDLAQAVRMASIVPARFIGAHNQLGEIRPGLAASFALLSPQNQVLQTWINGVTAPQNSL